MINKKQFRIFTILDLDKEEEYLREMHLKGWRYRTSRFGFFLKSISMNSKILEIAVGN